MTNKIVEKDFKERNEEKTQKIYNKNFLFRIIIFKKYLSNRIKLIHQFFLTITKKI